MNDHEKCDAARKVGCFCAPAGQPCQCDTNGVHMARVTRAYSAGLIEPADFAQAIHDADVFTGYSVLLDPEAAA